MNNETVGLIGLSSAGAWSGATVNNSPYDTIAQSATNGTSGFDINNYNITYINGKLTVNPLPVIVEIQPKPPIKQEPSTPAIADLVSVETAAVAIENPVFRYADINQLVPLQTATTGIKHAHELRWFYKHWLNDMFIKTRYAWLFNGVKHYLQTLIANGDVEIVNQDMKLPK